MKVGNKAKIFYFTTEKLLQRLYIFFDLLEGKLE